LATLAVLLRGWISNQLILLIAIFAGLLAGLLRARTAGRSLAVPDLRLLWLVIVAFSLQLLAFQLPIIGYKIQDRVVPIFLIASMSLLLIFTWYNRRQPGFLLLGLGLVLNLVVILLNGGWMPISPQTVERLAPHASPGAWEIGSRLGTTKDRVLPMDETRLWPLSDWIVVPDWFPYRVAFSLGDILIAIGAFWFLWSFGGHFKTKPASDI
jgi:hypothetical protein